MLTYSQRSHYSSNPIGRNLLKLMDKKQTNLGIAADVTRQAALLDIAENLGSEICLLKTHIDIIEDFTPELPKKLSSLAEKHHFLIFEDRKFADIGNTVKQQYGQGIYRICEWAHIINAHLVPGPGIIQGLKEVGLKKGRGLLLLAEMSSKENLAKGLYTQHAIQWAEAHTDFVIGFICTHQLTNHPGFIHMTPGVKFLDQEDSLGQQYHTPQKVIKERKSDLIIVGRGIYDAKNPRLEAEKYRKAGWNAYQELLF
ncbi:MAG: orotidine-5'-phosphate decarboxylase [Chlamydiales bacterium]